MSTLGSYGRKLTRVAVVAAIGVGGLIPFSGAASAGTAQPSGEYCSPDVLCVYREPVQTAKCGEVTSEGGDFGGCAGDVTSYDNRRGNTFCLWDANGGLVLRLNPNSRGEVVPDNAAVGWTRDC